MRCRSQLLRVGFVRGDDLCHQIEIRELVQVDYGLRQRGGECGEVEDLHVRVGMSCDV